MQTGAELSGKDARILSLSLPDPAPRKDPTLPVATACLPAGAGTFEVCFSSLKDPVVICSHDTPDGSLACAANRGRGAFLRLRPAA